MARMLVLLGVRPGERLPESGERHFRLFPTEGSIRLPIFSSLRVSVFVTEDRIRLGAIVESEFEQSNRTMRRFDLRRRLPRRSQSQSGDVRTKQAFELKRSGHQPST
jgi:hypothetical protein